MNKIREEVYYLFTVIGGVSVTLGAFYSLSKDVEVLKTKSEMLSTSINERLLNIEEILKLRYGANHEPNSSPLQIKPNNNDRETLHKRTL